MKFLVHDRVDMLQGRPQKTTMTCEAGLQW